MAVQLERRLFTLDEYERMIDAGVFGEDERIELIRGELVQMAPIGLLHEVCVTRLTTLLVQKTAGRAIAPRRFYSLAQVQYASTTLAPKTVYGRTNTLNFNGGGTIVLSFNSSGGGTYTYTGSSPGTITSYVWLQEPYRGRLWPIEYSGLVPMTLVLNFATSTNGSFNGTAYNSPTNSFPVSGNRLLSCSAVR